MTTKFFVSDTHFSHRNILKFTGLYGQPIRPFSSIEEMDETLIENWNKVVRDEDIVYHGGDVCISSKNRKYPESESVQERLDKIMPRLKGQKVLILGNHDHEPFEYYAKHFTKGIYSTYLFRYTEPKFVLSHFPLHDYQAYPNFLFNVHGHIHEKNIRSPMHFNISVENINYTPIHIDELLTKIKQQMDIIIDPNEPVVI